MKSHLLFILFALSISLVLTGCSSQKSDEAQAKEGMKMEEGMKMDMNDMPCHQMADGTWMGKCDDDQKKMDEGMKMDESQ